MRARTFAPVSPTDMLDEEFLKPLGLTKYRWPKPLVCRLSASVTSWRASVLSPPTQTSACAATLG